MWFCEYSYEWGSGDLLAVGKADWQYFGQEKKWYGVGVLSEVLIVTWIIYILAFAFRLPENPLDTEEDNTLLRTENLPQFDQLSAEKCWTGIGKLALEYESGVWALEERLKSMVFGVHM